MKKIYTSNYARKGRDPAALAISVGPPDWYNGDQLPLLAPSWDIVKDYRAGNINKIEYTEHYFNILEKERNLTPQEVADALPDECYLLCYEAPKDFCHRHLLAEWLNTADDILVEEWQNEEEQKQSKQSELVDSLFDF